MCKSGDSTADFSMILAFIHLFKKMLMVSFSVSGIALFTDMTMNKVQSLSFSLPF